MNSAVSSTPEPWRFSVRGLAARLFVTCWLIFTLHFATNTVREVFLALAIGDHLSYRVDEYARMHDDLFETPGRGWHIGNNPGASMLAAIPYAAAAPVINRITARVNRRRTQSGAQPPAYNSPWPRARAFYAEAWKRGYDVKFGLGAFVMQACCMAPLSAAAAVVMFFLLRRLTGADQASLWLSLLYAFGTPVFFRTGFLNQNMLVGHFALAGFAALWLRSSRSSAALAGLCGGMSVLMDYSGALILASMGIYCLLWQRNKVAAYGVGAVAPVLLLWHYQWQSFGNPFYPGQHYMPPVEWIERGYQGVGGPQLDLAWQLAFDYRFGLFLSCPLLLIALAGPWIKPAVPRRELWHLLVTAALLLLFFSGVNYSRLQFNTGIRYMAPALPLLFIPAALVLRQWFAGRARFAVYLIAIAAVTQSWCLAMYRDVERGLGLGEPILRVFLDGLQLPALTTISRLPGGELAQSSASPPALLALAGCILYGVWKPWERT